MNPSFSKATLALDNLNTAHLKQGIQFSRHDSGLIQAELSHCTGSSAKIFLFGAHVSSLKAFNSELLYLNPKSLNFGNAIRGGIPLIFPQFGKDGQLDLHGYARRLTWQVQETRVDDNGTLNITMELTHKNIPETLIQNQGKKLDLRLVTSLSANGLTQKLEIRTNSPTTLQAGFHTYFRVGDIFDTNIQGIPQKCLNLNSRDCEINTMRPSLGAETACLFTNHAGAVTILDNKRNIKLTVDKFNLQDLVMRHPGNREIADIPQQDKTKFICIEPAAVTNKLQLHHEGVFICGQRICFEYID